jgi:heterodisulfide reductase subunit B
VKYAFFPGCAVHASAKEYGMSCEAINKVLGIELLEIPNWNCCGSMDAVYTYNPTLAISLSARNLSLAEKMNLDVVTLCSACFFTLSRANKVLRESLDFKSRVDKVLNDLKLNYNGEVKVRHYLDVLINDVGLEKIAENIKVPLKGLKVASYYGCLLVRPPEIANFDDPEHPTSMDQIIETLGATSVEFIDKTRCCGASLIVTKENIAMEMTKNILLTAKESGAHCVVTPCPMCHFNLDARQKDIESTFDVNLDLPVLYITQLIGMAFGISQEELGLKRNLVSPTKLYASIGAQ